MMKQALLPVMFRMAFHSSTRFALSPPASATAAMPLHRCMHHPISVLSDPIPNVLDQFFFFSFFFRSNFEISGGLFALFVMLLFLLRDAHKARQLAQKTTELAVLAFFRGFLPNFPFHVLRWLR
jgi:hypothetical protein